METCSPSLDTIKMQVYFDMNYTSRRKCHCMKRHTNVVGFCVWKWWEMDVKTRCDFYPAALNQFYQLRRNASFNLHSVYRHWTFHTCLHLVMFGWRQCCLCLPTLIGHSKTDYSVLNCLQLQQGSRIHVLAFCCGMNQIFFIVTFLKTTYLHTIRTGERDKFCSTMNLTKRVLCVCAGEFLEDIHQVVESNLSTVSREITDSRVKTREELDALYCKMVSYILLRSGMGSPTDVSTMQEATGSHLLFDDQ